MEPITKVIYDANGNPIGVDVIANVLKPNGNAACEVTLTVTGTDNASVANAYVSVTQGGQAVPVLNNTDGTYLFALPKGLTATVKIEATGYAAATIDLTKSNTKGDTYTISHALVTA